MKKFLIWLHESFFAPHLDLRVRLFNILAMSGIPVGLFMGGLGLANNSGFVNPVTNLAIIGLAISLLIYSKKTGRYQVCYVISIVVCFFVLFPTLFFASGGYFGGMPAFFELAVVFTIIMLDEKKAIFFSLAELVLYIAICAIAYYRPDTINAFATEREALIDITASFSISSVALGICVLLHLRLFNEQNVLLAQASRAKTEFLSNASHEMRTPLTVVSVNVQKVIGILEDMGNVVKDPEAGQLLQSAQNEIMRLARMVGGMLTLASMAESSDKAVVDFTSLLSGGVEILRLNMKKRGNTLNTDIEAGLRVFGSADFLVQVVTNILQNAVAFTKNGSITLCAKKNSTEIIVTVSDTGTGIPEEMLPHIFERGVSEKGTGFGLFLCKTVIESHGGRIWVESKPDNGTMVYFTLPVYNGQ